VVDIRPDGHHRQRLRVRVYRCTWVAPSSTARTSGSAGGARQVFADLGAWTEFPQPNEWIHLWRYKNLQERFEARGAAMKDPAWQAYLAKGRHCWPMHSTLLMPTNYLAAEVN
jgi:hypothetical protein